MLFSDRPRTHYEKTLAHEVICQLRFPTILSINNVEPADFQERIREDFPQYARKQDVLPPQIVNGKPEPQPPVTNYHFLSQDGRWKLNLTKDFIALSTLSYPGWEEFARMLDKPLAAFIQLYKPAYFQRVGLRYLSIVSAPPSIWRMSPGGSCSLRPIWAPWRKPICRRTGLSTAPATRSSSWIPAAPPRSTPVSAA
ncbi:MAG: TIGR04255 family protein [Dysosmobacter sp.]